LRTQCAELVSVKEEKEAAKTETKKWQSFVNKEFEARSAERRAHSATVQGGRSGGPGGSGFNDDDDAAPVDEEGVKVEGA